MARRHILSIVALCIAVVVLPGALSRKYRKGGNTPINGGGSSGAEEDSDAVWLFHFGPVDAREEYLNPLTGEVNGYHVDILNAVCEIAERNCEIVYDVSSNCWDNIDGVDVGGFGLFNFYYDACVAWLPTLERLRTFDFSTSFNQEIGSVFAVPTGNPGGFDPADLTGQTIGFVRGFFSSPDCVRRHNLNLSEDQIVYFDSAPELRDALNGSPRVIDAAFDIERNFDPIEFDFLTPEPDTPLRCTAGGAAFMTRKDNRLNSEWMNEALDQLIGSDQYDEICAGLEGIHGDKVGGTPENTCIGYEAAP